jgi:predicted dehydrogenase
MRSNGVNMIKLALIGLGNLGHIYTKAILDRTDCVIAAACDISTSQRNKYSKIFPNIRLFESVDILLGKESFDAAFILTSDSCHKDPFIKCLDSGKHVFVEKPVGNSIEEIIEMVNAIDRNSGLVAASGHILRYFPINREIKKMAQAGTFGQIFYLEGDYIHNLKEQADPDRFNSALGKNWYLEDEKPMVGGGCHPFDVLRWVVDSPVESVVSMGNNIAFEQMRNDDCVVSLYKYKNGAVAKVTALYAPISPMPPCYNISVYGTKATVWRDRVCFDHNEGFKPMIYEPYVEKYGHGFERELEDFIQAIKELSQRAKYVLTVCTGSALLAKTGLLKDLKATTNKMSFDWVAEQDRQVNWARKARWVNDDKYYTSSGISAGIDMTLGFVCDIMGKEVSEKISYGMEYIWNSDKDFDPFSKEI